MIFPIFWLLKSLKKKFVESSLEIFTASMACLHACSQSHGSPYGHIQPRPWQTRGQAAQAMVAQRAQITSFGHAGMPMTTLRTRYQICDRFMDLLSY